MNGYLYETHLHTSQASACGRVQGADYIDYMIDMGYQGMIVTDHFFNGNSCVPPIPWKERVHWYASGFEQAKKAAANRDFDVFFGVEFNFKGDEYLIYGVDEKWLCDNEDIMSLSRGQVYERVKAAGAIMIQAHPYRERGYLSDIRLTPSVSDGIEIYNAANRDNENALAYRYAQKLNVPVTAGSDIHYLDPDAMGGMLFPERLKNISDFVNAVLQEKGIPVKVEKGRCRPVEEIPAMTVPTALPGFPVFYEGEPV